MPDAFTGKEFEIFIMTMEDYADVASAANWSTDSDTTEVTTLAKNFELSAGGVTTEYETFFGDARISFQSPREPYEISFTARIPKDTANKNFWETLNYGATPKSDGSPVACIIGVRGTDGTDIKSIEFKNATMSQFDMNFEAESYWQAEVTFTVPPTDDEGDPNVDFNTPTFVK